jgi:hypothetical protein
MLSAWIVSIETLANVIYTVAIVTVSMSATDLTRVGSMQPKSKTFTKWLHTSDVSLLPVSVAVRLRSTLVAWLNIVSVIFLPNALIRSKRHVVWLADVFRACNRRILKIQVDVI